MKYTIRIYIVIFMLSLPAILTMYFPNLSGNSEIEHRPLQNMPAAPKSFKEVRNWPQQFDQFASDRFPYREKLINFFGEWFYRMGLSISPEVVLGADGWLFLSNNNDTVLDESRGIKTLSPEALKAWVDEYIERRDYLNTKGVELRFVIVPNKHTIYPEFLNAADFSVGPTMTDQVISALEARGVDGVIDLRPLLKEKARSELIYGKYNTHWNDRGAYFAYNEIIRNFPGARLIPEESLVFNRRQVVGDLARLIGYPELTEESMVVDRRKSKLLFEYDAENRNAQFMERGWHSTTPWTGLPSALFLADSFTNDYLYKYLAPSFYKALFKHSLGMQFDEALIEQFGPDYVAYIIVERQIPDRLN